MIYVRCKNHPPLQPRPTDKITWVHPTQCVVCRMKDTKPT